MSLADLLKKDKEDNKTETKSGLSKVVANERMERLATVKAVNGGEMKRYTDIKSLTGDGIAPTEITAATIQNEKNGSRLASVIAKDGNAIANDMSSKLQKSYGLYGTVMNNHNKRFAVDTYRDDATTYANATRQYNRDAGAGFREVMDDAKRYAGSMNPEYLNSVYKTAKNAVNNLEAVQSQAENDALYQGQFSSQKEKDAYESVYGSDYSGEALARTYENNLNVDRKYRNEAQERYDYYNKLVTGYRKNGLDEMAEKYQGELDSWKNELDRLDNAVSDDELKWNYAKSKKIDDYKKLKDEPDFDKVLYFSGGEDGVTEAVKKGEANEDIGLQSLDVMSDDEKNVFLYLYKKKQYNKAYQYLNDIEESMNLRRAKQKYQDMNGWDKFWDFVPSGLNQAFTGAENVGRMLTGFDSAPTNTQSYVGGMLNQELSDNIENANGIGKAGWWTARTLYNLGTTTVNMVPSIIVGNMVGTALASAGVAQNIATQVGKIAGATAMGGSAAGNSFKEMRDAGYGYQDSANYATLVGLSESCLEYALGGIAQFGGLGEEQLKKLTTKIGNSTVRAILNLAIDFNAEGVEEACQEYLEPAFKTFLFGEKYQKPEFSDAFYAYLLGGMSAISMNTVMKTIPALLIKNSKDYAQLVATKSIDVNTDEDGYFVREYLGESGVDYYEKLFADNEKVSQSQLKNYTEKLKKQYKGKESVIAEIDNQYAQNSLAIEGRDDMISAMARAKKEDNVSYARHLQTSRTVKQDIISAAGREYVGDGSRSMNLESAVNEIGRSNGLTSATEYSMTESKHGESVDSERVAEGIRNANIMTDASMSAVASTGDRVLRDMAMRSSEEKASTTRGVYGSRRMVNGDGKYRVSDTAITNRGSESADVVATSDGTTTRVEVVGDRTADGDLTLKTEDGQHIKASEMQYSSNAQAYLYKVVGSLSVNAETANKIIKGWNQNTDVDSYVYDMVRAYTAGFEGDESFHAKTERDNEMYQMGQIERRYSEKEAKERADKRKYHMNEQGVVDSSDINRELTERERASVSALEKMAQVLGVRIHLYETTENNGGRSAYVNGKSVTSNGFYADGEIWLDIKAGDNGEGAFMYALSHELVHFMKDFSIEKYRALEQFLIKNYRKDGKKIDVLVQEKLDESHRMGVKMSRDEAYEEVIANSCESFLMDEDIGQRIAELRQSAKGREVISAIRQFLADVMKKIRKFNRAENVKASSPESAIVSQWEDTIDDIAELFAEGVASAADEHERFVEQSMRLGDAEEITQTIENTEEIREIVRDKDGNFLIMEDGDGKLYYSERTYNNGGKAALKKALIANGMDAEATLNYIDERLKKMNEYAEKYALHFSQFKTHLGKDVARDRLTGLQRIFSIVKNGEYPANIDFMLECKKRQAYTEIMNRLIKDGVLKQIRYSGDAIAEVNMILSDMGFETQCLACFVEARRQQFQTWAETFVSEWNETVRRYVKDATYFFEEGEATVPKEEMRKAMVELASKEHNDQGNIKLGRGKVTTKMGRLIRANKTAFGHLLRAEDLLTTKGLENIRTGIGTGDIYSLIRQRYGSATPKVIQAFNPYNSEILELTFESLAYMTGEKVSAKKYIDDAKVKLEKDGGNPTDEEIQNEAIKRYLYDIGGARVQSFSDYLVENSFDMLQLFSDLAVRELPIHGYTKEIACVRLYGMNGCKWNGSLISHCDRAVGKKYAGLMPYSDENAKNGITVELDGKRYVIQFDDYSRNKTYGKYSLQNPNGSFIQSIGYKDIIATMLDPRYSADVGNITVGLSDNHIKAMLRNPLFRMVIPYHASGMLPTFSELVGTSNYNDYTDYQNTTVKRIFDKNGKELSFKKGTTKYKITSTGQDVSISTSYDFNEAVQRLGDAKLAADEYINWCRDRTKHEIRDKNNGLIGYAELAPKFSSSPDGYDFTQEENYYKLLEDFNTYDCIEELNGRKVSALQGGVSMRYAGDGHEGTTLTEAQLDAYRQNLTKAGIFTDKDVEKYVAKAKMSFDEILEEAVKERYRYHEEQDPKMESAVAKIEELLLKKYKRNETVAETAEQYSKAKESANKSLERKGEADVKRERANDLAINPPEGVYRNQNRRLSVDPNEITVDQLKDPLAISLREKLDDVFLPYEERMRISEMFENIDEVKEIRFLQKQKEEQQLQKRIEAKKRAELRELEETKDERIYKTIKSTQDRITKMIDPVGGKNRQKLVTAIERFIYKAERTGRISSDDREQLVNILYHDIQSKKYEKDKWVPEDLDYADSVRRLYQYMKGKKIFGDQDMRQKGHKDEWKEYRARGRKNGIVFVNPAKDSGADISSAIHIDSLAKELVELFPNLFQDYNSEGNDIRNTDMTELMTEVLDMCDEARDINRELRAAKKHQYLPTDTAETDARLLEEQIQTHDNLGIEYAESELDDKTVSKIRHLSEMEYAEKLKAYTQDSKVDVENADDVLLMTEKPNFLEIYERNLLDAVNDMKGHKVRQDFANQIYDIIDDAAKELHVERDYLFHEKVNRDGSRTYTEEGKNRYLEEEAQRRAELMREREAMLAENRRVISEVNALAEQRVKQAEERAQHTVKNVRAEKYRAIERMEQKQRAFLTARRENQDKRELRSRLIKSTSELRDWLLVNSQKKHVPENLKKPVAELLDAINMDTTNAEERIKQLTQKVIEESRKENPDTELVKAYWDRINELDEKQASLAKYLDSFREAYMQIKESEDPDVAQGYLPEVEEYLTKMKKSVGDTPISAMSAEQMSLVLDAVTMVKTAVRNANKGYIDGRNNTISEYARKICEEIKKAHAEVVERSVWENNKLKMFWGHLKPVYAMKFIGSEQLTELYEHIENANYANYLDNTETREFFIEENQKHKASDWDMDEEHTFELEGRNKNLSLTTGEIMSLYAYSRRAQANEHIRKGGIVHESDVKRGAVVKSDTKAYNLTEMEEAEIINTLTDEQKLYVEEMMHYLSAVCGGWGNEVTMALYGIKSFKEEEYFPIRVARNYSAKADESAKAVESGLVSMKGWGFTKEPKPMANQPMMIGNFNEVWSSHASQMALYHNFTLPMEDIRRAYNYTDKASISDNGYEISIKAVLEGTMGAQASKYIENLLKDINGQSGKDNKADFLGESITKFKKAKTFASLSVMIQQPSAIGRSLKYIRPESFKGTNYNLFNYKEIYDEAVKYAPVAGIKRVGSFDTSIGLSTAKWLISDEMSWWTREKKLKELFKLDSEYRDSILSSLPEIADEATWALMWEACKNQIATDTGLKTDSERCLKEAGELFTRVVEETQVYDSVLSRSQLMRSSDKLAKMSTAFMAEPTTTANMMMEAYWMAKKGDIKQAKRNVASVVTANVLNAVLSSLVYAARDDDEDETYFEKYLQSFTGELMDSFNPLTYLTFVKDIWSIMQGYDVERTDVSIYADVINAVDGVYSKTKTLEQKLYALIGSVANLFGLPVGNIWRDIKGGVNLIKTAFLNERVNTAVGIGRAIADSFVDQQASAVRKAIKLVGGNLTDADELYMAYLSGDNRRIRNARLVYDNDEVKIKAVLYTKLRDKDNRVLQAAQARMEGDIALYSSLVKEITGEGIFDTETVVKAVQSKQTQLKKTLADVEQGAELVEDGEMYNESVYRASDFPSAVENGDENLIRQIKDELIKKYGTAQKAYSSMKTAMTTYYKPLYQQAYKDKDDDGMKHVREKLQECGLYSPNDITRMCKSWIQDLR